jgi:3-methyladenine DNA glycosylase AlkD
VNNWDLVDSSAHLILGPWLFERDRKILYEFADSKNLWVQRIAVLTTYHFIRNYQYKDTLRLAETLLNHKHDLIHKAVGWMLREIGNRDYDTEYGFLVKHYKMMPRTMLRYSIEKFPEEVRQSFLKGEI